MVNSHNRRRAPLVEGLTNAPIEQSRLMGSLKDFPLNFRRKLLVVFFESSFLYSYDDDFIVPYIYVPKLYTC